MACKECQNIDQIDKLLASRDAGKFTVKRDRSLGTVYIRLSTVSPADYGMDVLEDLVNYVAKGTLDTDYKYVNSNWELSIKFSHPSLLDNAKKEFAKLLRALINEGGYLTHESTDSYSGANEFLVWRALQCYT